MAAAIDVHHQVDRRPDAPVLVLSNSLGTTLRMWDPQVEALRHRFTLVRYDHRGHGDSPVPPGPYAVADLAADVLELLDRLEVASASFCGLSLGGMVGIWLAANRPERVERLVLCCTTAHIEAPFWTERAAEVRARGLDHLAGPTMERWFTAGSRRADPDLVERMTDEFAATPREGFAGGCEALAGLDLREELGRIESPTLVLCGELDPALPADPHGDALVTGIRASGGTAHLRVIAGAAHLPNLEQPEVFTDAVLAHLCP